MGKIVKEIAVFGDLGEETVRVLLDSGAGYSLVRRDVADKLSRQPARFEPTKVFRMANGAEGMRSNELRTLFLRMKGKVLDGGFYVIDAMPRPILVGVDFLQRWEIRLDLKAEDYEVGADPLALEIAAV